MPKRNIVFTEHQDALIEALVQSGRYQDASEVLSAGLRLVESREAEEAARLKGLREAVQVGLDDLDNDRAITFDGIEALQAHLSDLAEGVIGAARSD